MSATETSFDVTAAADKMHFDQLAIEAIAFVEIGAAIGRVTHFQENSRCALTRAAIVAVDFSMTL